MNEYKIYGLFDPRTNDIRYIGQTKRALKHRLNQHIQRAKLLNETNHRCCWIRSLLSIGLMPEIKLIQDNITKESINQIEVEFIKHYRNLGYNLTNTHDGGNYCDLKPETIEKIKIKNTKFNITKEELYQMYVIDDMTQKEIAQRYGCYESTIANKRKQYGIESRKGYPQRIKDKMSQLSVGKNKSETHKKNISKSMKNKKIIKTKNK